MNVLKLQPSGPKEIEEENLNRLLAEQRIKRVETAYSFNLFCLTRRK